MIKNPAAIFFIALLMLVTSACGWHLRGTASGSVNFERIHISIKNPDSELLRRLKKQLEGGGVEVVGNAKEAPYSLVIVKENSTRRTATVSASARVSERSLTETAIFLVLDKQASPVIPRSTVRVERVFEYHEDNVLATNDEAELLKREMRGELARQIYNRLRQLKNPASPVDASAS